jgi:pectate lyase
MKRVRPSVRYFSLVLSLTAIASTVCSGADESGGSYISAVRAFADAVMDHGRDTYGKQQTPLFVDGLHAETLEPVRWQKSGETWVLSNFASQQPLMRLLDGLTALTGEPKYRQAAEEASRYALKHLQTPNGLLYWGGHLAWDLQAEKPVGQGTDTHELKGHQPYYELMWRVDPQATRRLMEAIWAGHILDWSLLDYNRHASVTKLVAPQWDHAFNETVEVPFPAKNGNLSFANVTPPFLHCGASLAILADDGNALTWTRRLLYRWQQGKDPTTGLCGGQLSYRKEDRAQDALGHVHPNINEAKIVASYHQTSRYHQIPLAQMQAGEALIAAGGMRSDLGHELIRWASDDLKTYAQHSYDPQEGVFVALMTDGTPIRWRESKTGYYVPDSFAPVKPDSLILWNYAMAYRLTRDDLHWRMARALAKSLGLGDIGQPSGGRLLRPGIDTAHWQLIYGLLELHRATGDGAFRQLACRVGDRVLKTQSKSGLFPRSSRRFARTGDEAPLALLHLAAALDGKSSLLPPAIYDSRFFHCEYDGPLDEDQKKRADKRTYDHLVFYGGS